MHLVRIAAATVGLGLVGLLSACGGGGTEELTAQTAAGLWNGTADSMQREVSAVTLSDGRYFAVYSGVGTGATIAGGVQGTATVADGTLNSSDLLSFSVDTSGTPPAGTATTGTFTAQVVPRFALAGTATVPNQPPVKFQANYESEFERTPTLAGLAGSYTGDAGFASGVRPGSTFTISATGGVTSTINGCSITGTVVPRTDGNAYDLSLLFGGSPCALPNLRFDGIVFLRHDGQQLYSVSRNTQFRQTIVFSGLKQAS